MHPLVRRLIPLLFLGALVGAPAGQAAWELSRGGRVQVLDLYGPIEKERRQAFEDELRRVSFIREVLVPRYQEALVDLFQRGNERAELGRDGWIYYKDDLDLVTGPGILQPGMAGRAALDAIVDWRDRLAERGVVLLVVPVPNKASEAPEAIQLPHRPGCTAGLAPAEIAVWTRNPDREAFLRELEHRGVEVWCPGAAEAGPPIEYLPRDTHWTPESMSRVAERLAGEIERRVGSLRGAVDPWRVELQRTHGLGDLVSMLGLPPESRAFRPMQVVTRRVRHRETGQDFRSDPRAEVLLLGDSFARVFSDPELGLAGSAGLAEHLALHLKCPLDVIAISGGGASETREALRRRPGGLDGKRIVAWQFSMRDLAGDPGRWRRVPLPPPGGTAPAPAPEAAGSRLEVLAEVVETSWVPEGFDYELCLAISELRVLEVISGEPEAGPLWVAFAAVRDREPTRAASLRAGDRLRLSLEDLGLHHDLEKTAWVDDTEAGRRIYWPLEWEESR